MPLRKLFKTISDLLLTLKSCWRMSPLSVSYFWEAETYKLDIDDISLERLKGECVKEVKRLNGNFTFKDANDWQKGYYTKENDVEKEADTNSPWGDNLRASFVENCQDFCTIRLRRG